MTAPTRLDAGECTAQFRLEDIHVADDEGTAEQRMAPHARALNALRHGLRITAHGFHIAVVGGTGTGRTFTALALAEEEARRRPVPDDLVLLPNSRGPLEPIPAFLPAGCGPRFVRAMEDLFAHLEGVLHDCLEGATRNRLVMEVQREHSSAERSLRDRLSRVAARWGLAVVSGEQGFEFVPIEDDDVAEGAMQRNVQPEAVNQLALPGVEPDENAETGPGNRQFVAAMEHLSPHFDEIRRELAFLEAQTSEELIRRQRDTLRRLVEASFASIPAGALPTDQVREHVQNLHAHLVDLYHLGRQDPLPLTTSPIEPGLVIPTLLTTADSRQHAPMVHAQSPTLARMFGRVVTSPDENRWPNPAAILAGDLHRANGGFLVVDGEALIKRERVYEHLKSCLLAGAILPLEEGEGQILRPHPIDLDVKVLLIGTGDLLQQLHELDPEFGHLFKIRADFSEDMVRDDALRVYPTFCRWLAHHRNVPPCDRGALERLLEHGARLAEDKWRVSAELGRLADVVTEAAWLAGAPATLTRSHIAGAIAAAHERDGQLRQKVLELHETGTIRVDVTGVQVGQLNGLSVISDGFASVGRPMRVTAVTYAGEAGPINIDREVELSGPIHSKGVLILTGYLSDRFARMDPPSFGASVVFEQSYAHIEGDSASMVELLAILSSLAELPARQDVAVTGSVDQCGAALPVGGVNEKIEGFHDLCRHLGLSGTQGVVIPRHNVRNLVLREDVVEAIANEQFHVWAVDDIEQAVELLLGVPAGRPEVGPDGPRYPEHTVYGRIQRRLENLRERRRNYLQLR